MIEASQLSLEYLQAQNLDSLKAHLKTLKDAKGTGLKVGGKKGDLVERILAHHGRGAASGQDAISSAICTGVRAASDKPGGQPAAKQARLEKENDVSALPFAYRLEGCDVVSRCPLLLPC